MTKTLQVGVKVLIKNNEGKFLLLRRSLEKYPETAGNHWDIPGGRIDVGISLTDNLIREVKEETNLDIDVSSSVLLYAQDILKEDKHVVRLTYTGKADGEISLDREENDQYTWLTLDELKTFEGLDVYLSEVIKKELVK